MLASLINAVSRYYWTKKGDGTRQITKRDDYIEVLEPRFVGRKNETVFLLCLDAKSQVICCKQISEGTATGAIITVRKIVEVALAANASSVIIAHNHPNGILAPSKDDEQVTRRLALALENIEVKLIDHVLFAGSGNISFMV